MVCLVGKMHVALCIAVLPGHGTLYYVVTLERMSVRRSGGRRLALLFGRAAAIRTRDINDIASASLCRGRVSSAFGSAASSPACMAERLAQRYLEYYLRLGAVLGYRRVYADLLAASDCDLPRRVCIGQSSSIPRVGKHGR